LAFCLEKFGVSNEEFAPLFQTIILKNENTVLGVFQTENLEKNELNPHLVWAVLMIYLTASDGSIGSTEYQRLQSVMGDFPGLLKYGAQYALMVKAETFFISASNFLNIEQKIFILINAYDLMLADGRIRPAEKLAFSKMLLSFGYTEELFHDHHLTIAAKNIKQFDTQEYASNRISANTTGSNLEDSDLNQNNDILNNLQERMSSIRRVNTGKIFPRFIFSEKLSRIQIIVSKDHRSDDSIQSSQTIQRPDLTLQTTTASPLTDTGREQTEHTHKRMTPHMSLNMSQIKADSREQMRLRADELRQSIEFFVAPRETPELRPIIPRNLRSDWLLALVVFFFACGVFFSILFSILLD